MPQMLQFTLDFLEDLRFNNNKTWFDENRQRYDQARAHFETLVGDIIQQFAPVDDLGKTTAKDCIFRINRDVRFSKDKTPYKSNMGALIGNGGRKTTGRSYYLNLEPGGSFIAGGVYAAMPDQLKKIRQVIADDNGKKLTAIINHKDFKKYFGTMQGEALKTAPKGYLADHPAIELLKHKQFLAMHQLNDPDVLQDDFATHFINVSKALKPFERFFNDITGQSL